ncbi:response regulator [Corynebacterium flavescens]
MIRVLIADDQTLLVSALSTILNSAEDIEVRTVASDGASAVAAALENLIDVAVIDIRMPGMDGIAAAQAILTRKPNIKVIMLTTFGDEEYVSAALQAGAHGFLLKDAEPDELVAAIRAVHAGESVLASAVTEPIISAYRATLNHKKSLSPEEDQGLALLTPREREVLLAIASGASNREIAQCLCIAETTVKTHISALLSKLHARDRVALVLIAHRSGLLPQ